MTWVWLHRASNNTLVPVNLDMVSHIDDRTSPPKATCHLFFGSDDADYGLEVRGTAEEILGAAKLVPQHIDRNAAREPTPAAATPFNPGHVTEG